MSMKRLISYQNMTTLTTIVLRLIPFGWPAPDCAPETLHQNDHRRPLGRMSTQRSATFGTRASEATPLLQKKISFASSVMPSVYEEEIGCRASSHLYTGVPLSLPTKTYRMIMAVKALMVKP
ncbi:hypothetical protein SERLA73DRAFT_137355 [Serpula lacrymans var. lacrymans S7.3]|uniref:Uncharacterized protein n=1 Tax=Serpula lacrymans var. lacrymans (strain S7.3) TaxID=936435 RepID=F8PZ47_SERL3|nr:hypothetical protein SERLA73DRAFT_137355 [Serpula lacrymans var. lacrymans S7.3]